MPIEERVARVEGILEQMDKRLTDFDSRLNHVVIELRELRMGLNQRFFWLLGVQISMLVTLILAILLK